MPEQQKNSSSQNPKNRKRLGDILVEAGVITLEQLQEALAKQKIMGKRLGQVLIESEITTEDDIATTLAAQMEIPYINLNEILIPPEILTAIPEPIVRSHNLLPISLDMNRLRITMADPLDLFIIDEISFQTGYDLEVGISPESQIEAAIKYYYGATGDSLKTAVDTMTAEHRTELGISEEYFTAFDINDESRDIPVVNLVNNIIHQSIKDKASDIHIESDEASVVVKCRIDGMLNELMRAPKSIQNELVSRLKIMAQMDISEKRLPQDGRIKVKLATHTVDLRVSTLPTVFGEKIAIRILDKSRMQLTLDQVGFDKQLLEQFKKLSSSPNGILLMTGPTGSGKTSTLYAAVNFIKNAHINITTVENPVEYLIPGINQVQVRPEIGLSFARTLRSILRQDPNVILIGEIRDAETAQIAIESALTGHLVFSTLHTNDAASAVTRLIEMGIEPYLVASAVIGVGGQRLVRLLCRSCKSMKTITEENLAVLKESGMTAEKLYAPEGCLVCRKTGYLGRTAIHEIMTINDEIHELILEEASARVINEAALRSGMRSMRTDGLNKVLAGITTVEEVTRITRSDSHYKKRNS